MVGAGVLPFIGSAAPSKGCGVGAAQTIMTTDLGQRSRMSSGEGMALFASLMEAEGIAPADIRTMMVDNPRKLLGL